MAYNANAVVVCEFPSLVEGRELVAAIYITENVKVAFVDRLNSALIVVDRTNGQISQAPLVTQVVGAAKPADINRGPGKGTVLITYTDNNPEQGSKVIQYSLSSDGGLLEQWSLMFEDRTRSVALLDDGHIVATFQRSVRVFDRCNGDQIAMVHRKKRDKGGFMTADPTGSMFYFGDGDEFVGCRFDATSRRIDTIFRYLAFDVDFPRGSSVLPNGDLLVCCESNRIVRIRADGSGHTVVVTGPYGFGDVDAHPVSQEFVVTRWPKEKGGNVSPIIYRL